MVGSTTPPWVLGVMLEQVPCGEALEVPLKLASSMPERFWVTPNRSPTERVLKTLLRRKRAPTFQVGLEVKGGIVAIVLADAVEAGAVGHREIEREPVVWDQLVLGVQARVGVGAGQELAPGATEPARITAIRRCRSGTFSRGAPSLLQAPLQGSGLTASGTAARRVFKNWSRDDACSNSERWAIKHSD